MWGWGWGWGWGWRWVFLRRVWSHGTPTCARSTLKQSARISFPVSACDQLRATLAPQGHLRLTVRRSCRPQPAGSYLLLHDCRLGLLGLLSLALGPGAVPELGRVAWSAGVVAALAVYLASMARILLD